METYKLDELPDDLKVKVVEHQLDTEGRRSQAEIQRSEAETKSRTRVTLVFLAVFSVLNLLVFAFVAYVGWAETGAALAAAEAGRPGLVDRLVTPEVVMALVGATVVQLGSAMYLLARYFFERPTIEDQGAE